MNKVAVIQMSSSEAVGMNLITAKKLIQKAALNKAKLIVLPEFFSCFSQDSAHLAAVKEELGQGRVQDFLSEIAKEEKIWIIGGSIAISDDKNKENERCYNTAIIWNDQGEMVDYYQKMHLFDVAVDDDEIYCESKRYLKGDTVCVFDTPVGRIGLAICYDLRFPEIFRLMSEKGAEIIALPAAFTYTTGQKHWEILLRARAIENQCYILASNQTGIHEGSDIRTYGSSMIVNPWGEVLARQKSGEGVILSEINLNYLNILRGQFPALKHKRIEINYKTKK